ncbi:MAG: hypothetical protein H6937_01260 [Burkholderiales bacterium]|nr:hypothetical protein [Burkholderiales bacterium]MDR4518229.1 hypothetical protein [Nitrosomonas sp.]
MSTKYGTKNSDLLLSGTNYSDTIYGLGGYDWIEGNGGNDYLYGGADGDNIFGGTGNDRLYGESGSDHLRGDAGSDYLSGGSGNDILEGGAGNDNLYGGSGSDTFWLELGSDVDYIWDFNRAESDHIQMYSSLKGSINLVPVYNFGNPYLPDTFIYSDGDLLAIAVDDWIVPSDITYLTPVL